jgi:hypothetical protein
VLDEVQTHVESTLVGKPIELQVKNAYNLPRLHVFPVRPAEQLGECACLWPTVIPTTIAMRVNKASAEAQAKSLILPFRLVGRLMNDLDFSGL